MHQSGSGAGRVARDQRDGVCRDCGKQPGRGGAIKGAKGRRLCPHCGGLIEKKPKERDRDG